jgi:hypothetical protein
MANGRRNGHNHRVPRTPDARRTTHHAPPATSYQLRLAQTDSRGGHLGWRCDVVYVYVYVLYVSCNNAETWCQSHCGPYPICDMWPVAPACAAVCGLKPATYCRCALPHRLQLLLECIRYTKRKHECVPSLEVRHPMLNVLRLSGQFSKLRAPPLTSLC